MSMKCSVEKCGVLIANEASAVYRESDKERKFPLCWECATVARAAEAKPESKRKPRRDKGGKHKPRAGAFVLQVKVPPDEGMNPNDCWTDVAACKTERSAWQHREDHCIDGLCRVMRQHGKERNGTLQHRLVDVDV